MIIRYQKTEKIGDHSTTSILTVKDADSSSLDKVLKYFEPHESQQQIAIRNAQDEPKVESLPSNNDTDFVIKKRVEKDVVEEILAKGFCKQSKSAKWVDPTVLKHPEGNVVKKADVVQGPRKTVPLTGSTKGGFSIGELLGKPADEPKENPNVRELEDGLRLYRTKWDCPGCGNRVDRFSAATNEYVKCRDCGKKAKVEQSTTQFLEEDNDGYFFVAHMPLEV